RMSHSKNGPKWPAIELARPLRYTDHGLKRETGDGDRSAIRHGLPELVSLKGLQMSTTFETVANIIAETCDIPRDTIKPESHAIDDLGIDSLDFLDIAFAIDKAFGIKLPLEQWTQ